MKIIKNITPKLQTLGSTPGGSLFERPEEGKPGTWMCVSPYRYGLGSIQAFRKKFPVVELGTGSLDVCNTDEMVLNVGFGTVTITEEIKK